MKNIKIHNIETKNLILKIPTMEEQYALWSILKDEEINKYYFPTPDRIFSKNNLSKDDINDLVKARKIFMEQLGDWERQMPFYEKKIISINNEENVQKYTWSIFTKDNVPIGQMTVQPSDIDNPAIRDVGWYIASDYQGKGYATEAATAILDFMFNEVEIDKILTSVAIINPSSWKLMEKLGFLRTGEKQSTYFDDQGDILLCYCYECDKEKFLNK